MRINRLLICCAMLVLGYSEQANAQARIIQTIAGNGTANFGGDTNPASAAILNFNYMLSTDAANNLYIADNTNNRIRKIDASTGIITTIAGRGTPTTPVDLGAATASGLNNPVGVAVDPLGNFMYIGDNFNNRVRMVNLGTGIITTIAGTGTAGFMGDGAAAVAARISGPRGVAVDALGNVYFADANNNRIRMITASSGVISTIAGNGTAGYLADGVVATTTRINNPRGVYVDATGNVYFADMNNNRIRKIDVGSLMISTVAGTGTTGFSGDGGSALSARLDAPTDVTFDAAGNMYISDVGNDRIRFVDAISGNISTIAGSNTPPTFAGDGGAATAAKMNGPVSVALTSNGSFYISDRTNHRIRQVRDNFAPIFTGGGRQTLTVCENSAATNINTLLAVTDTDRNQTITWSTTTLPTPMHGTLSGFPGTRATNTGSVTSTSTLTYTPAIGYSGLDSFFVRASDGFAVMIDTIIVTINPLPVVPAIAGPGTVCEGANITLTNASAPLGVWSSTDITKATITDVSGNGDVAGLNAGTTTISYTVTNGCGPRAATLTVTVNPLPSAGIVTGPSFVCMTTTATMSDAVVGGVWTSSNTNIATVSGGVVTPVMAGSADINYTTTNACGSTTAFATISVVDLPYAGVITGPTTVCEAGSTISLANATTGGVWSVATGNASVSSGGLVTGLTAGSETISYRFTNSCGTDVATYPITVLPMPNSGTITGVTNNVCVGGTIALSNGAGGGIWSVNSGNASVSGSGVVTGVSAGSDIISYEVTNSCGVATSTFPVTVVITPSAGTITGATSVCVSFSTTLSNDVGGGVWTTATGNATISGAGVLSGVTAGSDVVSYTVSFSCGVATSTFPVTVNPLADAGVITGPSVVCIGSSATLVDLTPGGVWTSSNTSVATVAGGVVTSVASGVANILYSVTNVCGTISAVQTMTVSPIVAPSVTFSASTGFSSCTGTMVTYTAIPVNGGSSPVYDWKVNGTSISSSSPFNFTPLNGDVIQLNMTSSFACVTTPSVSYTRTMTVNPVVMPTVTISTGIYTDTVCTGTNTGFTAYAVNGGATPSFQWSVNGITVGSGNPYYYYPVHGDVVSAVLTSSNSCAVPATAASNNITMTVDALNSEIPKVDVFSSPGSSVCNKTLVTFIASTLYGGMSPFLLWTKNGVAVATGPTYSYLPSNGDMINCMLASSSGCLLSSAYDTVFSPNVTMSVLTEVPPKVTISASPATTVSVGETAVFTASVAHATPTLTFQWYVNGVAIAGETTSTFNYTQTEAGTTIINCVVTSGDVCNTTSISNMVNLTISALGITQSGGYNNIQLVPNPNKGIFTIEGTIAADNKEVALEIMNIVGQVVYRDVATVQNGALSKQVNMGNELANGVYMLHLTSGNERKVIRFSINK